MGWRARLEDGWGFSNSLTCPQLLSLEQVPCPLSEPPTNMFCNYVCGYWFILCTIYCMGHYNSLKSD